jgi:hypothetical protein
LAGADALADDSAVDENLGYEDQVQPIQLSKF